MPPTEKLPRRGAAVERLLATRTATHDGRSTESVPLADVAGRVLADPVEAPADRPAMDTATMDGFAFRAGDGYPLAVRDVETYPEDDPPTLGEGEAVRVATGAPLPERANAVLKREDATVEGGRLGGPDLEPGTHVHERASSVAAGETLFEAGERLSPKDAILLADLAFEAVPVRERFSVGVLATGTEIHEGTSPDRDSAMLAGLVVSWGHEATLEGAVPDQYDQVREAIDAAAAAHDVVVTSGGTSVGRKDHVIRALSDLGEVLFRGVRIRPGKPITVARLGEQDAVGVAVPGKPVAAHTAAALVARPLFTGETALPSVDLRMTSDVGLPDAGFEYAIPVTVDDGEAVPLGHEDSSLSIYGDTFEPSTLSSNPRVSRADGVVLTTEPLHEGDVVEVVPYPAVE